jgi:hypothetical protein
MKFYGRDVAVRASAHIEKLGVVLALIKDKAFLPDQERAIKAAGADIHRVFHSFSPAEVEWAVDEARAAGRQVADFVGVPKPFLSAEDVAEWAAKWKLTFTTEEEAALLARGFEPHVAALLGTRDLRTQLEIDRDEARAAAGSGTCSCGDPRALGIVHRAPESPCFLYAEPVEEGNAEDEDVELSLEEARERLKAKGYLDGEEPAKPAPEPEKPAENQSTTGEKPE